MRDEACRYFQRYDEPIRSIFIFIFEVYTEKADYVNLARLVFSCIAFIVNFFHLLVLSRKAMRSSSINILMIGLAMSDMICCSIEARGEISDFIADKTDECEPPYSYALTLFLFATSYIYQIFRRLSPWIGVIMAFVRFLISSFPFNNSIGKMSEPLFAVCSLIISSLISILIEADSLVLSTIRPLYEWIPNKKCGFPKNYSQPIYQALHFSQMQIYPNLKITFNHTKLVFKYLPSIILPLLTIGLVMVLRKVGASKQRLQRNSKDTTYQTTRLVTIMTCCLVVTEVTTGLLSLGVQLFLPDSAAAIIIAALDGIFLLLFSLNSIAHCFITMLLSSQYRSSAREVFPCLKLFGKRSKTESAPASFQSISKNPIGLAPVGL